MKAIQVNELTRQYGAYTAFDHIIFSAEQGQLIGFLGVNGAGNYYIEAQTRDMTRTDIIVDYLGQRYIIELKIWRGERYNAEGEQQLREYLDYFQLDMGYMLSFNFNKNKRQGVEQVQVGEKLLIEAML